MKIDYPVEDQIPALRHLWQEAFGDSDTFLDLFFGEIFSADRCRCVTREGQVAAALYWLDCRCEDRPLAYLYAVATAKKYRGRGLCRDLIADTHRQLRELGYAGTLLVPGAPALVEMYGNMGYDPGTTLREFSAEMGREKAPLAELTAAEYAAARREMLPRGGVVQEGESLTFLSKLGQFYRGEDFLLWAGEGPMELLGNCDAAPGILAALGKERGTFRTPGADREFAMYHPLKPGPVPTYFGFAFD